MNTQYSLYETSLGWGAVTLGAAGLTEVFLPFGNHDSEKLRERLIARNPKIAEAADDFVARSAASRLAAYFAGERVNFEDICLDFGCFTAFQRDVYRVVAEIPYGKALTYREVAAALGRPGAARGIGSAMGRNPFPVIIPCHRVVGSSGAMTGYSAPGGIASKQWLLRLEGIALTERGRMPVLRLANRKTGAFAEKLT